MSAWIEYNKELDLLQLHKNKTYISGLMVADFLLHKLMFITI